MTGKPSTATSELRANERSAGRPKAGKAIVDKAAIAEAAWAVIEEYGAAGLTISRLAKHLGVRSQTLYYHFASITDVVNIARGEIMRTINFDEIQEATSDSDKTQWSEAVSGFALAYYRAFAPFGQGNSIFFAHAITNEETLLLYEKFITRATEAPPMGGGLSRAEALQLLLDVEHTIFSLIFETTIWSELFDSEAIAATGVTNLAAAINELDRSSDKNEHRLIETVQGLTFKK